MGVPHSSHLSAHQPHRVLPHLAHSGRSPLSLHVGHRRAPQWSQMVMHSSQQAVSQVSQARVATQWLHMGASQLSHMPARSGHGISSPQVQ